MILLIPLLIVLTSWLPFLDLSSLSLNVHNQCLDLISFKTAWRSLYESLICGAKLPHGHLKNVFIQGGLIHLMVISGAHLLFLEKFWNKIPLPNKIKTPSLYFLLTLYAIAARLYPPITRALFSFCIFKFLQSKKIFINSNFIVHLSGMLCLLYKPSWIHSNSLQLSWLASLAQNSKTTIKKCLLTYLIIFPIINRWQQFHPFTIIINWLLAPFVGAILFPLSFLTLFFHPLHWLTDQLWEFLFKALELWSFFSADSFLLNFSVPENWTWVYINFVLLMMYLMKFYNNRLFSPKLLTYKS